MSPWGLLQSSNAARAGGRSRRDESRLISLWTQTQTPANLICCLWKKMEIHGRPWRVTGNLTSGGQGEYFWITASWELGAGCPSEWQLAIVQVGVRTLGWCPREMFSRKGAMSVLLSFLLVSSSYPLVLVKGSVRGLSPRLRTGTVTHISAVGSRSCLWSWWQCWQWSSPSPAGCPEALWWGVSSPGWHW